MLSYSNKSMNKWTSPALRHEIETLESLVRFFKNPFLNIPIAEMDLEPQTLAYFQRQPFVNMGFHLLTLYHSKEFPEDLHEEITQLLEKNGFDLTEQGQKAATLTNDDDLKQDVRFLGRYGLATQINKIADILESQLETLKRFRSLEWERTHIVTVRLPQGLLETYNAETITNTATKVVHQEFSKAAKMVKQEDKPSWLNQLMMRLRETLTFSSSSKEDDLSYSLEIAVKEDNNLFPECITLRPAFKKIAADLSGNTLTEPICDELKTVASQTQLLLTYNHRQEECDNIHAPH